MASTSEIAINYIARMPIAIAISRRNALAAAAPTALTLITRAAEPQQPKPKHLLLRSGWQTINIGDIAHTPGLLRLLQTHLKGTKVTLWPNKLDEEVTELLTTAFPNLTIAHDKPAQEQALKDCDFMLHGSGPSVVGEAQLRLWHQTTKRPFGVYGVTFDNVSQPLRDLLNQAAFVFCRDTDSLKYLRQQSGVKGPLMDFAPDSTFALHVRDEEKAAAYLKSAGLEEGKFMCAIPRLRYTPYPRPEPERKRRAEVSDRFKEVDHAKLREAIIAWVRTTGQKVLACPEMTYQLDIIQPLLIDPLPDDVKKHVVRRQTYWGPDEAASTYARAAAVVSFEMHSPIIAAAAGTPAIHLRQPTDTRKGQMWRDIGLGDWLFEIDQSTGQDIAKALLAIHADPAAARTKLANAMTYVRQRQQETMASVAGSAGGTNNAQ
jgi:polysaccharide pyruvyl transferase WcaK-like protein